MDDVLSRARKHCVQFKTDSVTLSYEGIERTYEFEYRDPWEWILSIIQDESLAPSATWNSARKFYCSTASGSEERIYDEPYTADTWWGIDTQLPHDDVYPHCYLPLHFWLDKGMVTRRVKMYPMILRPAWLPREIRNASGNGGGVLVGYMPVVEDPYDPKSRTAAQKEEFAHFRRELYQKILEKVFKTLRCRSHYGEAHKCADGISRVLYPGILIESQDAEEAANFCGCRSAQAHHPCPKCLVFSLDLSKFSGPFELRTPSSMKNVLVQASNAETKGEKEAILKASGMHNINHFLWKFRFADPYKAYSYDTLHSDDLGKWGKHLWPVLLDALEKRNQKGRVTQRMAAFPRWSQLKHFNSVTTTQFTDGQAFYDILKCILPCIVDFLPKNSVLVHCIRAYLRFRILVSLKCMTTSRLDQLKKAISVYEQHCKGVTREYGKNFNFLKQHAISHVIQDIQEKGTVDNFSTRTGEGFQQEASQAYKQTNMKNAEHQMCVIDEKQEAVALIRMRIDDNKRAHLNLETSQKVTQESDAELKAISDVVTEVSTQSWRLGSPEGKKTNVRVLTSSLSQSDPWYNLLDSRVREYILSHHPEEAIQMRFDDDIPVQRFKYIVLKYQSLEDWGEGVDILRCNKDFHGRERYDCVIIHDDSPRPNVARLCDLFRCWLPSGRALDIALVNRYSASKWRPNTVWEGCRVLQEEPRTTLIEANHLLRGALLCPVSTKQDERTYYFIDSVDSDMFLCNNPT
ncbi:hypothetical protein BJ165DRAFT_1604623 [Panaeolus papilionaceus]|nr:hypothetical protein BJ165DRAFT_1604623 [Panaeolus papilionaceus]